MPDQTQPNADPALAAEAARLAGWNPADGPPPYGHALPPDDALISEEGDS